MIFNGKEIHIFKFSCKDIENFFKTKFNPNISRGFFPTTYITNNVL